MYTKIYSACPIGVETYEVQVEVDLSFGLLNFSIVGLPDTAIKESRQRIQSALKNSGIKLPERKITVNLAPADLKKEGTLFDLPIAIGILQAAQILHIEKDFLEETFFVGELSLDGTIKGIKGVLPMAFDAPKIKKKRIILPLENAQEAALIKELEVIGVSNILELISYIRKEKPIEPTVTDYTKFYKPIINLIDFKQVKGQQFAKRALQISAAGMHNILFIGSPGSGKTMLAKRLPTIMPDLTFTEILQTSKIYSITGKLGNQPLVTERPFRNPHHTISQAGLVGGGSFPQPGEISLAHNGILFLDELTEFKRDTLEALRQPLEQQNISIARAQNTITFPASFLLIVALNPCPCGFFGDKKRNCSCTITQIFKYISKLSGPLLDRIDLQVSVSSLEYDNISRNDENEISSKQLYAKVCNAIEIQKNRFGKENFYNAHMTSDMIDQFCKLTTQATTTVKQAFERLNLTMRGYHKLLKVSRTIADLDNKDIIEETHIKEALILRSLDRTLQKENLS